MVATSSLLFFISSPLLAVIYLHLLCFFRRHISYVTPTLLFPAQLHHFTTSPLRHFTTSPLQSLLFLTTSSPLFCRRRPPPFSPILRHYFLPPFLRRYLALFSAAILSERVSSFSRLLLFSSFLMREKWFTTSERGLFFAFYIHSLCVWP